MFRRALSSMVRCSTSATSDELRVKLPGFWASFSEDEKIIFAATSSTDRDYLDPEFLFYRATAIATHSREISITLLLEALELNPQYEKARTLLRTMIKEDSSEIKVSVRP